MALDLWNRAYDQEEESRAFFNAKLVDRAWQVGELSPLSLQELLQTGCEVVLERIPGTPFGTPAPGTPGLCAGGQRVASSVVLVFWCLDFPSGSSSSCAAVRDTIAGSRTAAL